MLDTPLPRLANIRKAVSRNAVYEGWLKPGDLPDLTLDVVPGEEAGDTGVSARISFSQDADRRAVAEVTVSARVRLECQRSLKHFTQDIQASSTLGLLVSESQANDLPKHYEPWIAEDEEADMWRMVAEEIALALPSVAYGPPDLYPAPVSESDPEPGVPQDSSTDTSPFGVLAELLENDDPSPAGSRSGSRSETQE